VIGRRRRLFALGYASVLGLSTAGLEGFLSLDLDREPRGPSILSAWQGGRRVARHVTVDPGAPPPERLTGDSVTVVRELVLDEGPVLTVHPAVFALSFVAGRDGIHASFAGRDAYLTADDLLAHQLYDPGASSNVKQLRRGIDLERAVELLAGELGCGAAELRQNGSFRRFVARRQVLRRAEPGSENARDARVTALNLERSAKRAASFLVRQLGGDGLFRYEFKATSGERSPGYNWPRHGGATLFLAEAAGYFGDSRFSRAARRAAQRLRERTTLRCGSHACIGEGRVGAGSRAPRDERPRRSAGGDERPALSQRRALALLRQPVLLRCRALDLSGRR
jgi:hypothetical protein